MSDLSLAPVGSGPDWLVAEMPPGYQTRFAEIQRLSSEIQAMDRMGRLLWEVGPSLAETVREVFVALKLEAESLTATGTTMVSVRLDNKRRLLIHVAETDEVIQKKSDPIARVFQLLHEVADDDDRVVLVANVDRLTHPKKRSEPIAADALALLRRLGVNFLPAPSLFALWVLSQKDQPRARHALDQLHAQDGDSFVVPGAPA